MAGTFQDRLVTELRLASATTIAEAQAVLERFLPRFNARFTVATLDLGAVLAFWHTRTVARDNTVKYHWRTLQLLPSPRRPSYAGSSVDVLERPGGELAVRHQGETIPSRLAPPRPAQVCCASAAPSWRATRRSSASLWTSASGWPARPAGGSCRGERDRRQRCLTAGPGQAAAPAHPASRRSGRPSARHNCRGSRCAPSPACSASPATRSAAMCSPAAHPDARVRHHLPGATSRADMFAEPLSGQSR